MGDTATTELTASPTPLSPLAQTPPLCTLLQMMGWKTETQVCMKEDYA